MFFQAISWLGNEKLNLTQQKQTTEERYRNSKPKPSVNCKNCCAHHCALL